MDPGDTLSSQVLVLNNSFQPVHICSARRAIILAMLGKAEILEYYDQVFVHTVNCFLPVPSVIRLMIYVQPGRRTISLNRRNLLRRDGYRCQYCGSTHEPLTTDHIVPRARQGEDSWENLVTACVRCNNQKGNRTPEMAGMSLLRQPRRPNYFSFIRFHHPAAESKWRRYLFLD